MALSIRVWEWGALRERNGKGPALVHFTWGILYWPSYHVMGDVKCGLRVFLFATVYNSCRT